MNARNSSNDAAVHVVMGRLGMADGKDYQIAELRFAAILPALETDRVDAGVLIQPFSLTAQAKGYHAVFSTGDAFGPSETVVWGTRAEFIAKNRAILVDMMEDHILLRRWIIDPKTRLEAVKLVAQVDKFRPRRCPTGSIRPRTTTTIPRRCSIARGSRRTSTIWSRPRSCPALSMPINMSISRSSRKRSRGSAGSKPW